jgi:hypothetical protein
MTRPEAATRAVSWQDLITTLHGLSDEDFAALSPASLDPVEVQVRVRFDARALPDQG